jgi:hypothetical protein
MSRIKNYIDSLISAGINVFGDDDWYESYQNYLYEKYGYNTQNEKSDTYVVKSEDGDVVLETDCLEHAFYIVDDLCQFQSKKFKVYGV